MRNKNVLKPSTLFAIGMASDIEHDSGSRKTQIMAIAYGEAGNVLRLIKPRVEALGWDGRRGTKLRSLNPISSENGYWIGDGGPIQSITFASDMNGLSSWLAVLKSECTTILRPTYHQVNAPSTSTIKMGKKYPPSRLNAKLIVAMRMESTGGRPHADVSFNPWYVRQFAVVDKQGHWSVWNIEGQKSKRVTFEATPGRSGHIHDDSLSDLSFKSTCDSDGWGRILWAGSVSTLIVCDRHNLAVFDLKATPKRLYSPPLVRPDSGEWILDVKRDPNNLQHIFVLTTRHVFWLQVTAAGEDHDELSGYVGARILLPVRHFRNDEDDTAKLALFDENDGNLCPPVRGWF
jgi:RNA polymerase I-specific transcription initiation factor RRN6